MALKVVREAKLLLWSGLREGLAFNLDVGSNWVFLVTVKC